MPARLLAPTQAVQDRPVSKIIQLEYNTDVTDRMREIKIEYMYIEYIITHSEQGNKMQMVNAAAYTRIRGNYFMYARQRVDIK